MSEVCQRVCQSVGLLGGLLVGLSVCRSVGLSVSLLVSQFGGASVCRSVGVFGRRVGKSVSWFGSVIVSVRGPLESQHAVCQRVIHSV